MEKETIIIDIEFTGIDNEYIRDNEIVQLKMVNLNNNKTILRNFNSKKEISAHGQITFGVERFADEEFFTKDIFVEMLNDIGVSDIRNANFCGFNVRLDKLMLNKYNIRLPYYWDIKEALWRSDMALRLITEGNSLETAYYLITGNKPEFSHADLTELMAIREVYNYVKDKQLRDHMQYVPFGPYAGMPIRDYVSWNRKMADGYRKNNSDAFAEALDYYIFLEERGYSDDEDEEEYDEDEF